MTEMKGSSRKKKRSTWTCDGRRIVVGTKRPQDEKKEAGLELDVLFPERKKRRSPLYDFVKKK